MSTDLILAGSWSPYNEYKLCKGQNPDIFLPSDKYESDFLVRRIENLYPQYTNVAIELSISYVKRTLYGGCKRSLFVELVMSNLLQRKPLIIS
ncbi:MAG: hypothetical protein H0X41_11135 [Chitinophagaceae bacterium]|nr:hypothetical protein [Chitinophagaceae bacterium]